MGKWYEVEATNHIEEFGGICIEANYQLFFNGSVEVDNRQIMES
jgi:lipocalin